VSINKRISTSRSPSTSSCPTASSFGFVSSRRASYADDMGVRKAPDSRSTRIHPFSHTALVSRQLSKGSRLLVLVTVNKNAWAQVNYGTGKDVERRISRRCEGTVECSWYNDSFVKVPLWR